MFRPVRSRMILHTVTEDIDVPDGEGEAPPRYEEIVESDAASVSDRSKFNITNPIKSMIKKDKSKVRATAHHYFVTPVNKASVQVQQVLQLTTERVNYHWKMTLEMVHVFSEVNGTSRLTKGRLG